MNSRLEETLYAVYKGDKRVSKFYTRAADARMFVTRKLPFDMQYNKATPLEKLRFWAQYAIVEFAVIPKDEIPHAKGK